MSESSSGGVWAVIGKISAVLTVIATVLGIYLTFNPSRPEVVAKCDYNSYALPPDLIKAIEQVRQEESWDSIEKQLKILWDDNGVSKDFPAFDIARHLGNHLQSQWPEQFKYGTNLYGGFWYISIANTGDRIANDVVLDVPFVGVALVTGRDEAQEVKVVTKTLALGALRPGDSVSVALWSKRDALWANVSDVRLTHSGGLGEVLFPTQFYGVRAVIANNLGLIGFMGMMAIFIVVSILISIVSYRGGQAGNDGQEVSEDSTADDADSNQSNSTSR